MLFAIFPERSSWRQAFIYHLKLESGYYTGVKGFVAVVRASEIMPPPKRL
jgi:hypothetical protein